MKRIMRVILALVSSLVLATLARGADELLPVLRVGPDVYSNVTVTIVTSNAIYFTCNKGILNVKLKDLDNEMQQHFHFAGAKVDPAEKQKQAASVPNSPAVTNQVIDRANAQAVMDDAVTRAKAIINQPVRQVAVTPGMDVSLSSPGWFHDGAPKPDFKTVDVRTTRQALYDQKPYVTSDLNPGIAFIGTEIEFNPNTKYFYVDRTLPKKKLTEAEMVEVNRLYRIIGACEDKLAEPPAPMVAGLSPKLALAFLSRYKGVVVVVLTVLAVAGALAALRFFAGKPVE
jgi:hypothetical protein